ncbi:MAG TPA: DUF4446 family protein [Chthonomonadaceae bacterium]|nr:DUF4446 family protein [Chthonomonadaceae bacterium]
MPDTVRTFFAHGDNVALTLLTLAALVALLLLGWLLMALRLRQFKGQLGALTRGSDGRNLEEVLTTHLDTVHATVARMEILEQAVAVLQAQMPSCLQQAHLIRYNAFDDVGGEQSFSLALLDGQGNGVVLTSVYSRMDVRVYAKAIRNGRASHPLSEEETRALRESSTR